MNLQRLSNNTIRNSMTAIDDLYKCLPPYIYFRKDIPAIQENLMRQLYDFECQQSISYQINAEDYNDIGKQWFRNGSRPLSDIVILQTDRGIYNYDAATNIVPVADSWHNLNGVKHNNIAYMQSFSLINEQPDNTQYIDSYDYKSIIPRILIVGWTKPNGLPSADDRKKTAKRSDGAGRLRSDTTVNDADAGMGRACSSEGR